MIINTTNISKSVRFLNAVLPAIVYSEGQDNTISLVKSIGDMKTTVGTNSEQSILLYNFLYQEGELLSFITNIFKFGDNCVIPASGIVSDPINNAFSWSNTAQGHIYWHNIYKKHQIN